MHDRAGIEDNIEVQAGYQRPLQESIGIRGRADVVLTGPDGEVKMRTHFTNLVTQVGDQLYGELGAGIGVLVAPTGMRLGTGVTAASKTGPGAAIGTYVTGSQTAFDGGSPSSSLSVASRRITYVASWAAGVATADGINEVAVTNESPITDVAGTEANTIARGILSSVVNKGALDVLTVTWTHDLLGV